MSPLPFRVLLITDEDTCARRGRTVVETVALALAGGAPDVAVLLRDKGSSRARVLEAARALKRLCDDAGAKLLVHTHADVALEVGAAGVHLADGVPAPSGSGLLVGASRHAAASLDDDDTRGFDYVALAPVFRPTSKRGDTREPLGLEGLRERCERSVVPVVALGGIDEKNAQACLEAGASAVAVVGAVMAAIDPRSSLLALSALGAPFSSSGIGLSTTEGVMLEDED